jgi:SAM-dependent methyltransferase
MATKDPTYLFTKVKKARIFNNIRSLYQLDKKAVLDVGCSEGHYLACFGLGSMGLTIIDEHVELGRAHGLEIRNQNVEDPNFSLDRKFDAIWANNFFEHMEAPHPFLIKMKECLKPDGFMVLGVPVLPYLPFLTRFKKFRGAYAVSHVNFFYRQSLIETVRYAGWDVHAARLFYFKNPILDYCMNLIAPHIYVIATPKENFKYAEKRLKSLRGYETFKANQDTEAI